MTLFDPEPFETGRRKPTRKRAERGEPPVVVLSNEWRIMASRRDPPLAHRLDGAPPNTFGAYRTACGRYRRLLDLPAAETPETFVACADCYTARVRVPTRAAR